MTTPNKPANAALITLRRESWGYSNRKPGKVPPADSPSRPTLAALWMAAHSAASKRKNLRTFSYSGHKFGIVFLDDLLCVVDWGTRRMLVRPPTSFAALYNVLNSSSVAPVRPSVGRIVARQTRRAQASSHARGGVVMGTIKGTEQARALKEAREILKVSIRPGAAIWKRRVGHDWGTAFKRNVLVELLPSFELRVTNSKTGEVITQGPAWVDSSR